MEINAVCSLGSMCHTSTFLKTNKWKKESYPFDWIHSCINDVMHCIEDKFKIFLDSSYYVNIDHNHCKHRFYDHPIMFNHHNPIRSHDYKYFERCVNRFEQLLLSKMRKLFVIILRKQDLVENYKNNIISFNDKLKNYTNNYTLLCIAIYPNKTENSHIFTKIDCIDFLELETISESNGIRFQQTNDNIYIGKIIKERYIFNIKPLSKDSETD